MVGLDYVINLMDKSFSAGMKTAQKNTHGLDEAVGRTNKNIGGLKSSSKQGFGSIITWAKRAAIATGLVFGIAQVSAFGTEITNQTAKFEGYENAIKFASGADGAKNIQFLDKTIKDLNLDMTSSYQGFQTLAGSLKGTSLEGKATRDIFDAVGIAATTMNLTADQSKGAFLALGQMASKGKVQAEELRGQLGERIPGALGIAAKSMGMTQVEFNKMLDTGKVYAEDFLPKFAKELKKTFEGGLPAAANSMQAAINKKNNALVSFKRNFGDATAPVLKKIQELKAKFYGALANLNIKPILGALYNLKDAVSPITNRFKLWFNEMGGGTGIMDSVKNGLDKMAVALEIASNGVVFLWDVLKPFIPTLVIAGIAMWAMSAPVMAVVVGIGLLAGGLIYAYEKVGWFRGSIMAIMETVKGFGNAIKIFVVDRLKQMLSGITGIGGALMSFFKGNWKKAWEQGKEAVKNITGIGVGNGDKLIDNLKQAGINGGKAYADGLEQAKANNLKGVNPFDKVKDVVTKTVPGTATQKSKEDALFGKNNTTNKQTLGGSASGGTASKNITFKIESFVKELKIQPQTLKEGLIDVEKTVKEMFIRMIRDVETQAQF